ncbi:hypothetical protein, partial [thiotrophic endosymbiont of Bathymodiolus puteoserpentis (Logatchev)]|uniref:hypothetical protein n=1 Tax=thiotrophic endosymbiont of Bathymodiolus puteoserpentis (Logatchev) TaxID=343240 RepID=UPI0010B2C796
QKLVDLSRVIVGFIVINQFVVWFLRVDYLMLDLEKGLTLKLLKIYMRQILTEDINSVGF